MCINAVAAKDVVVCIAAIQTTKIRFFLQKYNLIFPELSFFRKSDDNFIIKMYFCNSATFFGCRGNELTNN